VLPGHLFDKIFFLIGILSILGGLVGQGKEPSRRTITALTGLFIVFLTLKGVIPLSGTGENVAAFAALVTICGVLVLQWRGRGSGGTAV